MSLSTQAKILRVIQEMRFERVGGGRTFEVDVRIIAATNKDLEEEIAEGRFREDLYFRLNVIPIHVSPLRERREDVGQLAKHFVRMCGVEYGRESLKINDEAVALLSAYDWPGNIRELRNVVERMVILCREDLLTAAQVPPSVKGSSSGAANSLLDMNAPIKDARREFERRYLLLHLEKSGWNISKTATGIGMDRSSLYKKMKELEIETPMVGEGEA
jgi:two-component system nitrogen regulation response regulator NtrX